MSESVGSMVGLYESLVTLFESFVSQVPKHGRKKVKMRLYEVAATMVSGQSGQIVVLCECGQFHCSISVFRPKSFSTSTCVFGLVSIVEFFGVDAANCGNIMWCLEELCGLLCHKGFRSFLKS